MKAALLAALLVSPVLAADSPAPAEPVKSAPLSLLEDSFGESGVETLAARGLIVLHGKSGARRLSAVQWKAFSALARAMPSCLDFAAAADALGHEPEPAGPDFGLAACRALPPDGLMTPSLHALAAALQAGHEERWALHRASVAVSDAPGRPNLFDTAWGRDLIERRHADALENPASLAKMVFDELLAGPRPDKEAAALFSAEASARGAVAPETLIVRDGERGALSEELRAQLRRTLSNERRRWAAAKARAAAADLLAKPAVKRELEDLRGAARALTSRPNLPEALEAAASRAPAPSAGAHLLSAGLHLQEPTRLGQHELGDEAIVSGAYWVDGLAENDSIEVEESVAVETERGFSSIETHAYKRRNGGPYPFARTVKITEIRPFAVRSIISTAGSAVSERVEVPIVRDFELALIKESEAAGLRAACRLKDAETAAQALETLVSEPAKVKPQYRDLAQRARKLQESVKADSETLQKLEDALAAARADSAPQLCRYETDRVDEALKLAKRLPPGCDRDLPELHGLRATIARRAADQNWFLKASAEARSKFASCDLDAALARWSEALATLEADPGARCGRVTEEENRAKDDIAELSRLIAWRDALRLALAQAEAEAVPARRLDILRPATSRLGALNESCLKPESRRAAALSEATGLALTAPTDNEMTRRLPQDKALAPLIAEVRAERARRLEAATAVEKAPPADTPKASSAAVPKTAPVAAPKAAPAAAPKAAPAKAITTPKKKPVKRPQRKAKEASAP